MATATGKTTNKKGGLETLSLAALRTNCKAKDISFTSKDTKPTLIAKLKAAQTTAKVGKEEDGEY